MKKIFSLLAAVLFAGSMMAETSTLTFTQACGGTGTASDDVAWTVTSDATESSYDSNKGIHYGTGSVAVSYLTLSTSGIQGTITKVVVNASGASGQSPKVNVSVGGAGFGSEATASSTAANYTFEGSAEGAIVVTISQPSAKKALYCKSIEVTYTVPAGTVATPLISGEAEFTESTTVTITCSTEGAVLYYTLDGTEPNNSATAYSAPFNLTETATVKAIAYNQSGDQTSAVASKTFTKVAPLPDPTNCAEAAAAALSVSGNNVEYKNGAVYTIAGYVTSIQTAYSATNHNITFWMADTQDGGNVLEAYRAACASEEDAPAVGDKVSVTGKLTKYNTTPEFAAGCTFVITEKSAPATNLGAKTIAEFLSLKNTKDTCILTGVVDSIKNTQYGNLYLSDATAQVYIYGVLNAAGESKKFADLGVEAGDTLTVKAIYGEHQGAPQVSNAIYVSSKKAEGGETPVVPGDTILPEVLNVAEAISAADGQLIKTNDTIEVRGVVTKLEFKGTNFKRYGSVNVYVADATGAEGSFEFYNCYSLEADTFRTSSPAYDPNGSNYEYFTFVTDGNNVSLWIGDTVKAIGKYNKYNTTYQLNTGCYLTEIIAGPRVEPDPAVDPDPIEGAITVAKAIELVNAMGDGKTSTHEFTVEGYVVNAEEFSWASTSQLFFLADDAENSGNQVFEAYYCTGMENGQPIALINGDKVQLTGHLQKYVKDAVVTPEISNAIAEVIEKAAGERPTQPTAQEITVAQALTIGAGVEHNKLTEEYYSITGYITKFVDLNKDYSFWMADAADGGSEKATAFEVYKPVFDGTLQVGDKVNIFTRIKNYSQTIESETGVKVTVVEALQIDTINVATAVNLALELEDNKESIKDYVVLGYVASIRTAYDTTYHNISFYMSDDASATYGDLQVYRGSISKEEGQALGQGDRVMVVGKLKNNFFSDQNSAQMAAGAKVSVMWKQAIEHIVLTEKVNKVIMDGVLYIVRDGKLYNIQGAQVR